MRDERLNIDFRLSLKFRFDFFFVVAPFGFDATDGKMEKCTNDDHRTTKSESQIIFSGVVFQKSFKKRNIPAWTSRVRNTEENKPAAGGPMIDVTPRNKNKMPNAVVYRSRPTQSQMTLGNKDMWGAGMKRERFAYISVGSIFVTRTDGEPAETGIER